MSRTARLAIVVVVGATTLLDVVAYQAYRNTVDGQAALPNALITILGLFAIAAVWGFDRAKRHRDAPGSSPPSRANRYLRRTLAVLVGMFAAWELLFLIVSHL